jgi:hypothetical protein
VHSRVQQWTRVFVFWQPELSALGTLRGGIRMAKLDWTLRTSGLASTQVALLASSWPVSFARSVVVWLRRQGKSPLYRRH